MALASRERAYKHASASLSERLACAHALKKTQSSESVSQNIAASSLRSYIVSIDNTIGKYDYIGYEFGTTPEVHGPVPRILANGLVLSKLHTGSTGSNIRYPLRIR